MELVELGPRRVGLVDSGVDRPEGHCCVDGSGVGRSRARVIPRRLGSSPSFVGFRFPPDVVLLAVRLYLRCGLSYRDVEELLAERGGRRASASAS